MPQSQIRDSALLDRIAKGDPSALSALYDRYNTLVFSIALDVLADIEDEVVGLLGSVAPRVTPRDTLKLELMRRIESDKPVRAPAGQARPERPKWSAFFELFSPAMAMACLVLAISLSAVNVVQWQQSKSIRHQLSSPVIIHKMKGSPLAPDADGTFVISQDRLHGVLVASDLPKIPEEMEFHLWLLKDGEKTSVGTFRTTSRGYGVVEVTASRSLPEYQSIMVTMEPAGAGPVPRGPEMMIGSLHK